MVPVYIIAERAADLIKYVRLSPSLTAFHSP